MTPTLAEIGRRALVRREALGLSQLQVAERADVSPGYISRMENAKGGMKLADLIRLSEALQMPATELLMGTETSGLIEQVRQIPAPADVVQVFVRIAGSLSALADEDRSDVVQGLGLLANALERMAR